MAAFARASVFLSLSTYSRILPPYGAQVLNNFDAILKFNNFDIKLRPYVAMRWVICRCLRP